VGLELTAADVARTNGDADREQELNSITAAMAIAMRIMDHFLDMLFSSENAW
jgi:hypothetical protein